MSLSYECCVLSGRGLCEGSIPHPEDFYRVCVCVRVCVRACVSYSKITCKTITLSPRVRDRRGQNKKERINKEIQITCFENKCSGY